MALRPDERHLRVMPDTTKPQRPDQTGSGLTMQPGFPGQLGLLAKQMNNGFGGGLLNQRNYLNSFYKPMQMQVQQNQGDDAKFDPTMTGTGTETGMEGGGLAQSPAMAKFPGLANNMPTDPAQLQYLQEYFKRMGYMT